MKKKIPINKIDRCPFCGGPARLGAKTVYPNEIVSFNLATITCSDCGVTMERNVKKFCEFTEYCLHDFLNASKLRKQEEKRFEDYENIEKNILIERWNRRI